MAMRSAKAGFATAPSADRLHPCSPPQVETIRANVIGCLNLADTCLLKGLHMTYYGTGEPALANAPPPLSRPLPAPPR